MSATESAQPLRAPVGVVYLHIKNCTHVLKWKIKIPSGIWLERPSRGRPI